MGMLYPDAVRVARAAVYIHIGVGSALLILVLTAMREPLSVG